LQFLGDRTILVFGCLYKYLKSNMESIDPESPRKPDMLLQIEDPETHRVEVAAIYHEHREVPAFYVEASSLANGGLQTFLTGRAIEDGRAVSVVPTPHGPVSYDRITPQ
jgi:hypothetical protein